jgi:hypothetical protein
VDGEPAHFGLVLVVQDSDKERTRAAAKAAAGPAAAAATPILSIMQCVQAWHEDAP